MTQSLSPAAARFAAILQARGLAFTIREMAASTRTATDAAAALGCDVAQIAKSLIFRAAESGRPILVIASGANRVNEATIGAHLGEAIVKADAVFAQEHTGFAIGGVPPFGHPQPLTTFIDADLLGYDVLWAAAGSPRAVFRLTPADLVAASGGTVVSVA